ncbi:hypothetical protein OAM69_07265 [bacterium]|nr:hypothetical protein [bacterium]
MLKQVSKALLGTGLVIAVGVAAAAEQQLECKLYIAESLDHANSYSVDSTESTILGLRRGGVCVFTDGSVADKQFVMGINSREDGAAGDAVGISVYTFESGDSLTLNFIGGWDKGPFSGDYTVLRGTGVYEKATGTGTISGADSPWGSTAIVDIKLNLTVADG